MKTIGFIGCGNMGRAMVEGIMKAHLVDGDHMIVSNVHPEKLSELSETYDCYISDNESVATVSYTHLNGSHSIHHFRFGQVLSFTDFFNIFF